MKAVGETKNRNHRYRNTARSGEAICCLCCRYGCKHGEMHEIERVGLRAEQAYRAGRRRRQTANSQRGWKAKSKTESGDGEEEYVKGVRRLNHCSTRMAAPTPTSRAGCATSGLWSPGDGWFNVSWSLGVAGEMLGWRPEQRQRGQPENVKRQGAQPAPYIPTQAGC